MSTIAELDEERLRAEIKADVAKEEAEKLEKERAEIEKQKAQLELNKLKREEAKVAPKPNNPNAGWLLVILTLSLHLYHGIVHDFRIVWWLVIPAYFVVSIFMAGASSRGNAMVFLKQLGIALIASIIHVGLIFLIRLYTLSFNNQFFGDLAWFLILAFPPLTFYIIFSADFPVSPKIQTIAAWWIAILALAFLILTLSNYAIPILPDSYENVDAAEGFTNVWDRLSDGVVTFWGSAKDAYNQTTRQLDPHYYTSQVEKNEERPLGVALEDIEPIDPYFFPENEVILGGYINAETFLQDSMFIIPSCQVSQRSEAIAYAEPVEVFRGLPQFFECRFPPETFEKGIYPVDVRASFDFETWADITYDFVLEEKARDFARLQKDIYQELDIDENPVAIYTNGPVSIGMGGSRLPILVTDEEPYLQNAYIGFTVQSKWPRGELDEVHELELKIPNSFILLECDRAKGDAYGPTPDENVPSYDKYIFENVVETNSPFTSVRCKLGLDSREALNDLVANDKVTRTFIARTKYSYTLEQKSEFRVEG